MVVGLVVDPPFKFKGRLQFEHVFAVVKTLLLWLIIGAMVHRKELIFVVLVSLRFSEGHFGVCAEQQQVGGKAIAWGHAHVVSSLVGQYGFELCDGLDHGFRLIFGGNRIEQNHIEQKFGGADAHGLMCE